MRNEALEQRAMEELGRLNLAFLRLLIHYRGSSLERPMVGDSAAIGGLCALAPQQLDSLARYPVALFSLPGSQVLGEVGEPGIPSHSGDSALREFGLVASCFAWHLCFISPLAASMLLGWPRARCRMVASCHLLSLIQSTSRCWPSVRLRMATNLRFWDDLMSCVQDQDEPRWQVARVWGAQFMSGDN